jgi:hypothetical protein
MADDRVRRARLRAQRLEPRSREGALAVARDVCGIQAQDARAAGLSVRARCEGLESAEAPGLVRTWAWRGTLHLVPEADLGWILPLVAPGANRGVRARWRQLGLDEAVYERAREALTGALAGGPRTRAELREALAEAGVDASGQRLPHLVRRAAFEGLLHHPLDGTFARLDAPPDPVPRDEALAELARRYMGAYGPAERRDLAKWCGLPAADVRTAWAHAAAPGPAEPDDAPTVRLLPAFDTYLLGYADRGEVVPPEHAARVFPGGGWLHPVVLVDGVAAGTWRLDDGAVAVEPFGRLPREAEPGLAAEIEDVARFSGRS